MEQVAVFGQQVAPLLCEQGVIASDTLARLLKQVQDEIQQEDFCGLCLLLIVDGYKAREAMTLASMRPVMRLSAQEYIL